MMPRTRLLTSVISMLSSLGWISLANADAMVMGSVDVRLGVPRGCAIAFEPHQRMQWGVIDFGQHPRLDQQGEGIDAEAPGLEALSVICNPGTEYQLGVDGGLHGNASSRHLVARYDDDGSAARSEPVRLPYQVFLDAARRHPWPADELVGFTVPGDGRLRIPLYARIGPLDAVPPVGFYTDELKLTLRW
ncbi:Csu type fimbrial protein [Halotalea alkalilenta]|uniref:Spore coat protein U/FanG domain-containing protein n=1 Tax=Halotalea alkalilenta TaxID=376489 RepID=A0A172YEE0_9GAMM|nr:spore coat U domain-containing protein [Halotalea alkalilenta]ANF57618.1 hypothetical protein A5892_09220 [Halotalea alkalilenta]